MTKKISQLPAATSVDTNDEFVINQDGTTKKLTTANPWQFSDVNIDGGNIDGTAIGASSASSGAFTNLSYTGTLTGGTGVVNIGSGQVYKAVGGNVGIGIIPTQKLDVNGTALFRALLTSSVSGSTGLYFEGGGTSDSANLRRLQISASSTSNAGDTHTINAQSATGNIAFATSNTERMRIDSSGNVGVGTTAPNAFYKTHIKGTDDAVLLIDTSSANGAYINFVKDGSTNAGYIGASASFVSGGTTTSLGLRSQNDLLFSTGGNTERMRITSSGHAIIPAGVTLGTSAGVYNAANTLDDYEEGTWTPAWSFVGGGSVTIAGGLGHYTKIGRLVYASVYCFTSSISSPSGQAFLTGLPFTSNASINDQSAAIGQKRGFATDMPNLTAVVGINQSRITFLKQASNTSLSLLQGSDFNSAGSSNILAVAVTYQV